MCGTETYVNPLPEGEREDDSVGHIGRQEYSTFELVGYRQSGYHVRLHQSRADTL